MTSASFKQMEKRDFDLEIVRVSFKKCLQNDETVLLDEYLRAFRELCRFFKLTGPLLGFVAMDLEHKIRSVEHHLHSQHGRHYHSAQSMVKYEEHHEITHKKGSHPSGCRMLLRLHWALEFILHFMDRLRGTEENENVSSLAWEVYKQTLYNHHPWLTQKLAQVAVYALPSKRHLVHVMCRHDYAAVMSLLGEVVGAGWPVYDTIDALFADRGLLNIP